MMSLLTQRDGGSAPSNSCSDNYDMQRLMLGVFHFFPQWTIDSPRSVKDLRDLISWKQRTGNSPVGPQVRSQTRRKVLGGNKSVNARCEVEQDVDKARRRFLGHSRDALSS